MPLGDESQAVPLLCMELSVKFTPDPSEKVLNNSPKQPALTSVPALSPGDLQDVLVHSH